VALVAGQGLPVAPIVLESVVIVQRANVVLISQSVRVKKYVMLFVRVLYLHLSVEMALATLLVKPIQTVPRIVVNLIVPDVRVLGRQLLVVRIIPAIRPVILTMVVL